MFLLVEPPRPSLPFDPVFLVPALPPVLTRPIGRSLPYGPHQHHHRALNPILGFSNDPGRDGFDTSAVTAAELLRENNSTTSGIVFARVALEVESASRNTLADRSGPIETYCSSTVSSSAVGRSDQTAGRYAATAAMSRIRVLAEEAFGGSSRGTSPTSSGTHFILAREPQKNARCVG